MQSCRPTPTNISKKSCLFCDQSSGEIHLVSTMNLDRNLTKCAMELQDTVRLAKLAAGDMSHKMQSIIELVSLTELIAYMEDTHIKNDTAPVFRLAELARLYKTRLKLLGGDVSGGFNNTDLNTRILPTYQQDLQA